MELEVGMYVRTKDKKGITYIRKLTKLANDYPQKLYGMEVDKEIHYVNYLSQKNILKASHNIKDLIEEHDYIRIVTSAYFEPVYYSYGKLVIRDDIPIENYSNNFIAEVITHEQMENMSYKVGE